MPSPKREVGIELMKLLRMNWMTRQQIAEAMGISAAAAYRWVAALSAHGMLREASAPRTRRKHGGGRVSRLYSLAPEWGGRA